jgi:carboxyl-terminal processing protease
MHPEIEYDGPLVVMVNYNSASASEILAAAMQDYKRAIIVGSPGTFGKGTVQRFLNLDDYLLLAFDSLKPLGSLKITFQKFYRINGGSTQLKGVTPDIIFPDVSTYVETGEKDMDFPIGWDEIAPANYQVSKMDYNIPKLKEKSEKRVDENAAFTTVKEKSLELKKQKDLTAQSLNIDAFTIEKNEIENSNKKYEDAVIKDIEGFTAKNLSSDIKSIESDSTTILRNKEWLKSLQKDVYLYETVNILGDIK